jgi:hypothetical protein
MRKYWNLHGLQYSAHKRHQDMLCKQRKGSHMRTILKTVVANADPPEQHNKF